MPLLFCSLASGSSGNCQYIQSDKTRLLVDAGMSGKYVKAALEAIGVDIYAIDGILLTHEHTDHICGLGVLMRRYQLQLYVLESTWAVVAPKIGTVPLEHVHVFADMDGITVGDILVEAVPVSHDAVAPLCYGFSNGEARIGIATDLGTVTDAIIDRFKACDVIMIEANHDLEMLKVGRYPLALKRRILSEVGHLSNEDAGYIAREILRFGRAKYIVLAHLSLENNFPDLAYETVRSILEADGFVVGEDVHLELTYRDRVGRPYHIQK